MLFGCVDNAELMYLNRCYYFRSFCDSNLLHRYLAIMGCTLRYWAGVQLE